MDMRNGGLRAALAMGLVASAALTAGCDGHDRAAPQQQPGASPAAAQQAGLATSGPASVVWDNSAKGIILKYPADWQPKKNPDYELMLLPAGASKEDRRITIDIPDLPPHLPFMIRMGRVEHDYVQDLKKDHPNLQVQESTAVNLPDSTAKLVRSSWRQNGTTYHDSALLIIHASAVYIVDAQTDEGHLAATSGGVDSVRGSIQWTKR
jgi:hypothetical protein